MDITQLLTGAAIILGVMLMTVLAVVPLWLEHESERLTRERPALERAPRRARTLGNGPLRPGVA